MTTDMFSLSYSRSFLVHDLSLDSNKNTTTGTNSGAGTAYLSGTPEFISGFNEVHVAQSLFNCLCRIL